MGSGLRRDGGTAQRHSGLPRNLCAEPPTPFLGKTSEARPTGCG